MLVNLQQIALPATSWIPSCPFLESELHCSPVRGRKDRSVQQKCQWKACGTCRCKVVELKQLVVTVQFMAPNIHTGGNNCLKVRADGRVKEPDKIYISLWKVDVTESIDMHTQTPCNFRSYRTIDRTTPHPATIQLHEIPQFRRFHTSDQTKNIGRTCNAASLPSAIAAWRLAPSSATVRFSSSAFFAARAVLRLDSTAPTPSRAVDSSCWSRCTSDSNTPCCSR
jgi:hypothetical protein